MRRSNSAVSIPYWNYMTGFGIPKPELEYKFHPTRKWLFDMAWPPIKLAVEVQGGIWRKGSGAHSRPSNILRDMEKLNAAQLLGWKVFLFTPQQLYSGEAAAFILPLLAGIIREPLPAV